MRQMLVAIGIAAGLAVSAGAHHSFPAFYFEDQTTSIEGDVLEFDYSAPHAWVHVSAPDARGQSQRFSAEWANPTRLSRDGITKNTLKPGDHVVISGSPGRNSSEYRIHLKRIERPADGWQWAAARRR